ncbi:hypothetical protein Pcinc_035473 [Petrolisthes cinctipes]|uniref:Uncharacterized protein n=1 Tax=Petrolisthes cinctipes TaxID=88211 RepID=A0AAE1BWX1_PETCI|nr:hypothetical protein Pcinc_035473 [Petrolisthes cinctipes]
MSDNIFLGINTEGMCLNSCTFQSSIYSPFSVNAPSRFPPDEVTKVQPIRERDTARGQGGVSQSGARKAGVKQGARKLLSGSRLVYNFHLSHYR